MNRGDIYVTSSEPEVLLKNITIVTFRAAWKNLFIYLYYGRDLFLKHYVK